MPITSAEVDNLLTSSGDRYLLLLLTETSKAVPKVKPGIPTLAFRVLDILTKEDGPLDEVLSNFAKQRARVDYHRVLVDRNNSKAMAALGVCWLPQVRVVRKKRVLFRSSVSVGDNGQFLAQDVGGRSFVRRQELPPTGLINLVDALSAEIDRPTQL
jgi:hypothetical protein